MLRRLFILLFLISGFISHAQNFSPRSGPSTTAEDSRLAAKLNFYIPRAQDTTLNSGKDTLGALLYVVPTGTYWIRDTNFVGGGHKWTKVLKGSDALAPVRWYNVLDAGADTTGTVDASGIIQSAITAGQRYIYLPRGTYLISNQIQLRDSVTIKGDGPSTIVKLTSNITAFRCSETNQQGSAVNFLDFGFLGTNGTGGDSSQRGILIDTAARCYINNVRGKSLGGFAFTVINNGINSSYISQRLRGNILSNVYAEDCLGGVLFGDLAEYNTVSSSTFYRSTYGVVVIGGNNRIENNNTSNNTYGIIIATGSNNAHGIVIGNTINHCPIAIYADGVSNGMLFSDNMVYSSGITINNSTGIEFVSGTFSGVVTLNIDSCLKCNFLGVRQLSGPPTWNITGGTGSTVSIASIGDTTNSWSIQNKVSNTRFDIMNTGTRATLASTGLTNLDFGTASTYNFSTNSLAIGTLTPISNRKLHVFDAASTGSTVLIEGTNSGVSSSARILLRNDLGTQAQIFNGSSTNGFCSNCLLIQNAGTGVFKLVSSVADMTFEGDVSPGQEWARFKDGTGRFLMNTTVDWGQRLVVDGSARIRDSLFLGNLPLGDADDSVMVIENNVVYKLPISSFGSGTVTSFAFTDGSGFDGTVTNATTTPTLSLTTTLTQNSVPFIGASGALSQDNTAFNYVDANNALYVDSVRSLRVQSPLIIGGVSTTEDLTLRTTTGVGATGADMHFQVGNNGATEAITILNNGSVGILQTNPQFSLHVTGDIRNTGALRWGNTPNGLLTSSGIDAFIDASASGGALFFRTNTSQSVAKFLPNGRSIFGTTFTDLGQKLQVIGSARITDTLLLANVPTGDSDDSALVIENNVVYKVSPSVLRSPAYNPQSGTTYTVLTTDASTIIGLSNTAARTITLAAANAYPAGTIIGFKDEAGTAGTGNVTINRVGADTIDGATSAVISLNFGMIWLYTNGSNAWFIW